MMEFLTVSQNMPFSVALAVMVGIALLEGVASMLGAGVSHFLDALLPDLDLSADIDIQVPHGHSMSAFSSFLSWLRVGQVPVIILLVVFLTAFGLIGLGLQWLSSHVLGFLLPGVVAAVLALVFSLPVVRMAGGVLGAIIPKDETDAVTEASLVGRVATITIGTASTASPAEAKVKDQHGLTHYIMVEPDDVKVSMPSGSQVLLVRYETNIYKAIENTNTALVED